MKKSFALMALCLLFVLSATAQVKFTVDYKRVSPTELHIVFKGKADKGWHVYSAQVPADGPNPTAFVVDKISGAKLKGGLVEGAGKKTEYDDMFMMNVGYFEGNMTFTQKVEITEKNFAIEGYLDYQACGEGQCIVDKAECKQSGTDGPTATTPEKVAPAEPTAAVPTVSAPTTTEDGTMTAALDSVLTETSPEAPIATATTADSNLIKAWWSPSIGNLKALGGDEAAVADLAFWYIFILGFLGGLVALCTPCVWPIIPMTVSFFLKRTKDRKKAIRDAVLYGCSIVVIYVALGLIVTSIFGASALNDLSTNAIFNIFFFLMLLVFAASFFGGFEITLPSSWGNAVDSKADKTTGLLSIFLMAFTLSLVSFSCTGPVIGFLLVEASTSGGSIMAPAVGMLGFALALALPFTLFALFPSWLKSAPKSGGWLNVVKVVLGFLELAFALKFLSVADLAYGWHLLDRETFLALWIVIFALLGFYLLGKIKFPHDDDNTKVSVPRFFMALCSLAFAVYMVPGLWGAPLKAVSAFAPPMKTQDFNLDPVKVEAHFTDYDAGMAYARQTGRPVIVDFTGHGCVNCRQMEMAVWYDPAVRDLLMKDYVLISLYVDEKTRLPEPIVVNVDGKEEKLRTIGDKWSYLQRMKFGANAQPFYVILNHDGQPLMPAYTFDTSVSKFIDFLKEGKSKLMAQ
ncbi:MAG: cytochrome c biogenesis protein CcdA [Alloprevotella sp.]|nr:cytochrome c biogenesis protein CcdA [Alloprevotella sp.]